MQSNQVYQLPISNIAYHVYSPEDDLERMQAISRRAMQRTLDSYHEHEHLADLFQVELEKREQEIQERKRQDQIRKRELKARSKKNTTTVSTTTTLSAPQAAARRHHLRNSSSNSSLHAAKVATATSTGHQRRRESPPDGQKRQRRLSDLSTSDISGYGGEDEWRSRLVPSQSDQHRTSSGRQRSASSSPAAFPPSRQSPSNSSPRNDKSTIPIKDEGESSSASAPFHSAEAAAGSADSLASPLAQPSGPLSGSGRRKRKQAIPVHPSIVARIPGITLRMQREQQGDQMQVEILKDLSDYSSTEAMQADDHPHIGGDKTEGDAQSPDWNLQAKQDIRKVKESIDSARFGYASYAPSSTTALSALSAVTAPSTTGPQPHSPSNMSSSTFDPRDLDLNQPSRRSLDRDRHLSSSTDNLAWTASNANSTSPFSAPQDPRVLPLTWENFSTRECTVNRVVGKHNQELEDLEEAVQETISRQYYTHSNDLLRSHRLQPERESRSLRRASDAPMPSDPKPSSSNSPSGSARVSNSAAASPTIDNGVNNKRSAPIRATRSRTHNTADEGDHSHTNVGLVAHDDIELILKKKRLEKIEERRRQSSKEMSNDLDDDGPVGRRSRSRRSSTSSSSAPTPSRFESGVDVDMETRSGLDRLKRHPSSREDDELENDRNDRKIDIDGDVLMEGGKRSSNTVENVEVAYATRSGTGSQSTLMSSSSKSLFKVPALPTTTASTSANRQQIKRPKQPREDNSLDSGSATSSDEHDHDDVDDDDYQDMAAHGDNPRKHRRSAPPPATKLSAKRGKSISPQSVKTRNALDHRTQLRQPARPTALTMIQPTPSSARHLPVSPSPSPLPLSPKKQHFGVAPLLSLPTGNRVKTAEHVRRTKKSWNRRGRNTRKEDEVVDTTSDDSDEELEAERLQARRDSTSVGLDEKYTAATGPHVPHIQTGRSLPAGTSPESIEQSIASKKERSAAESVSTPTSAPVVNEMAESGGRTRARARSFSSSMIKPSDKTNFFESALEVIEQKRRETLAKKKAAAALLAEVAEEEEAEKKRKEETLALEKLSRAEKSEASNLPKSSKSLPGRVLRRSHGDSGAGLEMEEDPDCTSCRMELSNAEKAAWRAPLPTFTPNSVGGQEADKAHLTSPSLRIHLPKTWGSHAILCSTCRAQYLEHHMRCTACFYVPSQEELSSSPSNCSRCKAGTWLREVPLA